MNYKTIDFLSYNVFIDKLDSIRVKDRTIVTTLNPHCFMSAEKDDIYKKALHKSDILLPDGVGITKAIGMLKGKKIKKIAGMEIHQHLLNSANQKSLKCFYLGSSDSTLDKIEQRIRREFPKIKIQTFSPPFKDRFTTYDDQIMVQNINSFAPDILFVGMTAPKQEKWVFKNQNKISANIIVSVGAVFDFYAGTIKRPSEFWVKMGLEGMVRVVKEPRRLWRRFVYSDLRFMVYIFYLTIVKIFQKND